ncbi:hypothetical protein LCGC14_2153510 [marine sediment metagenome]|uniref:Uncharacterized protein n=1 Tax=marine sediment metagenome TaxID=412755 RepID=A0A0F9DV22_9ZZZZ
MSEANDILRVIHVLKTVPEKRLLIIELANSIPIKNGSPDLTVVSAKRREINLAIAEAKAYGACTILAVDALVRLRARKEV